MKHLNHSLKQNKLFVMQQQCNMHNIDNQGCNNIEKNSENIKNNNNNNKTLS